MQCSRVWYNEYFTPCFKALCLNAHLQCLTLKAPSKSVAYKILTVSEKIKLDISCELSAKTKKKKKKKTFLI